MVGINIIFLSVLPLMRLNKGLMARRCTREEVIARFKEVHGEAYDYSEVVYVNAKTKVKIWCKSCQEYFLQEPSAHKWGKGCAICGAKKGQQNKRLTQDQVIEQFKKIYGDKYSYDDIVYEGPKSKLKIYCNTCKGYFWQVSESHKYGCGCPLCKNKRVAKKKTLSQKEVIEQFKEVHRDKYDYSDVEYEHTNKEVKIWCKKCNSYFFQKPSNHKVGRGCPTCGFKSRYIKMKTPQEDVIKRFKEVHGNRYIYDFVNYKGRNEKILILCRQCGLFEADVSSHYSGSGCPTCNPQLFSPSDYGERFKKAIVYILRIFSGSESFYKVGITSSNIKRRYSELPKVYQYEIIKTFDMTGYGARKAEIEILKKHSIFKYIPDTHFDGYTECVSELNKREIDKICLKYNDKEIGNLPLEQYQLQQFSTMI